MSHVERRQILTRNGSMESDTIRKLQHINENAKLSDVIRLGFNAIDIECVRSRQECECTNDQLQTLASRQTMNDQQLMRISRDVLTLRPVHEVDPMSDNHSLR